MGNTVVVGAQWGDEGKAKITDLLAMDADIIIRYQGGCNAGHTVVVEGKTYKFHLIPSGILYKDKICVISAGTVIYPTSLKKEIDELIKFKGVGRKTANLVQAKGYGLPSICVDVHVQYLAVPCGAFVYHGDELCGKNHRW